MKKTLKRFLSAVMALAMTAGLMATSAFAVDIAAADFELKAANSVTVDGSADQTVDVVFTSDKAIFVIAFDGYFSRHETAGTEYLNITSGTPPVEWTGTNYFSTNNCRAYYNDSDLNGYAVAAGGAVMTVTYTVDKDTPTGIYNVTFTGVVQEYDFNKIDTVWTAAINVTNTSSTTDPDDDAVEITISTADAVNGAVTCTVDDVITVTVTSDKAVNGAEGVITYDATGFEYQGTDPAANGGKIDITKYWETATTALASLSFKALKAGTYEFDVDSTIQTTAGTFDDFRTADAKTATVHKLTVTVNDKAPTTYDVTVAAATNGTVTADSTSAAAGDTVTLTVTPDDNYTLDNLTVTYGDDNATVTTTKGTDGKYTFTMPAGNVTVTATFKEKTFNVTLIGATGVATATYDKVYTAKITDYDADNYNYTVTVTIDGTDYTNFRLNTDDNSQIIIPGRDITGNIVIKVTSTPKKTYTVEIGTTDYVDGYRLVTVTGNAANGYTYDGSAMYKVGENEYAYLVATADADKVAENNADTCIDLTAYGQYDVNGTGKVDFNDAGAAFGCMNTVYAVADNMAMYLRADVNSDGKVDTTDVSAIMNNYTAS